MAKAKDVIDAFRAMKLKEATKKLKEATKKVKEATKKVKDYVEGNFDVYDFPL